MKDLKTSFIYQKAMFERGQGWINWFKQFIYVTAALGLITATFNLDMPIWVAAVVSICYVFICYVIGRLDYTYGIWLKEAEIHTNQLNPYFMNLEKRLINIEKLIKEDRYHVLYQRHIRRSEHA